MITVRRQVDVLVCTGHCEVLEDEDNNRCIHRIHAAQALTLYNAQRASTHLIYLLTRYAVSTVGLTSIAYLASQSSVSLTFSYMRLILCGLSTGKERLFRTKQTLGCRTWSVSCVWSRRKLRKAEMVSFSGR